MGIGSIEEPAEGGTLGARAALAEALASGEDHAGQAAAIHARLQASGVPDGVVLLAAPCCDGALLAALRTWYAVAGCDPHDARLRLARRRLPGVPLWRCERDDLATEEPAGVVVLGELEALPPPALHAAIAAAAAALGPGGVLILTPGPHDLRPGTALMDTFDGEGLKIVCSAVVRRSGQKARLARHWMVGRDGLGVEAVVEHHTLPLLTPEQLDAALRAAGLTASHHTTPALPHGLWLAVRYTPSRAGS